MTESKERYDERIKKTREIIEERDKTITDLSRQLKSSSKNFQLIHHF